MAFIRQTSPHVLGKLTINGTSHIMKMVLLALLPALMVQLWLFGWGVVIQVLWCSLIALICETAILALRKRPLMFFLKDGSALVTAWLLALAIPAGAPWWLSLIGISFAIVIGKQLYGGMGYNPFNPAMLGYVLLLISFPLEMTSWFTPQGLGVPTIGINDTINIIFTGHSISDGMSGGIDGWTMATALDLVRENSSLTMAELWDKQVRLLGLSSIDGFGINLACLLGGLFLLKQKIISWQTPVAMVTGMAVMALLFWNGSGSESHGSPLFHLFSGATMMGAFFIVTDPVSGATSNKGRLIFGLGVGVITYVIRTWGGYPDGVAFATLLMNMAAPAIDYWTQPRTYGHRKANRGMVKSE